MPTAVLHVPQVTILLACLCLTTAMSPDWGTVVDENKTADPSYTNEAAPSDSYSMFKQLMEVKEDITGEKEQEPKVVKTLKFALKSLFEAAYKGFVDGFLPHVDRQRREATDDNRSYLDIVIGAIGALMGKQGCSEKIACRYRMSKTYAWIAYWFSVGLLKVS